ncbi:MAG: hypothetical protein ACK5YF_00070 [Rhodobacterales bacterium]
MAVSLRPTWHIAMPEAGAIHSISGACPLDIQDLPAPRNAALPRQMAVELPEQSHGRKLVMP